MTLAAAQRSTTVNRLLQTELAIRLYQQEWGELPTELRELTPNCLSNTLIDPYSNQPFVYQITETGFLLYSVGQDGADDGGSFADFDSYVAGPEGLDFRLQNPDP
jgi:hypothetical protein